MQKAIGEFLSTKKVDKILLYFLNNNLPSQPGYCCIFEEQLAALRRIIYRTKSNV